MANTLAAKPVDTVDPSGWTQWTPVDPTTAGHKAVDPTKAIPTSGKHTSAARWLYAAKLQNAKRRNSATAMQQHPTNAIRLLRKQMDKQDIGHHDKTVPALADAGDRSKLVPWHVGGEIVQQLWHQDKGADQEDNRENK
jgi:hypothetical protein